MQQSTVNIFVRVINRKQDNGDSRTASEILNQDYPNLTAEDKDKIISNL
jgi:hypothetical protein